MKLHLMSRLSATALILAPLALSAPASATAAQDNSASAKTSFDKGNMVAKKYCMTVEAGTGSRVSAQKCRTKAEWERLGFEVPGIK